jgi:hypothetical protein
MFADQRVAEGSLERRVIRMTSAERVACAEQLLESARKYLPAFEEWETNRSQEG